MNVACLILANRKPYIAGRLTHTLARLGFYLVMHVDKKVDMEPFKKVSHPSTRFLDNRRDVSWGGFSMVETAIDLARVALNESGITHFLHLSDDTYPIKKESEIESALFSSVDLIDTPIFRECDDRYLRISRVYLPDFRVGNLRAAHGYLGNFIDQEMINKIEDIKKAFYLRANSRFPFKFSSGANWWCLTRKSMEKCIDVYEAMPDFTDWFRYSAHPDESFFSSVLVNFLDQAERYTCPIGSIWDRPPNLPYEFSDVSDYYDIMKLPTVFARKFSNDCADLIDILDRKIVSSSGMTYIRF